MSKQIGVKCPECGNDDCETFLAIGTSEAKQEIYIYEDGTFEGSGFVFNGPIVLNRGKTGDVQLQCRYCHHTFFTSKARPIEEGETS